MPSKPSRLVLLFLISMLALCCGSAVADEMPWVSDVATAQQIATQNNKLILVHFRGEKCPPCRRVEKQVFSSPIFCHNVSQQFVPVNINATASPDLARRFGVSSWPTDIIMAPDGRELHRMTSPQNPQVYSQTLGQISWRYQQSLGNGDVAPVYAAGRRSPAGSPFSQPPLANQTAQPSSYQQPFQSPSAGQFSPANYAAGVASNQDSSYGSGHSMAPQTERDYPRSSSYGMDLQGYRSPFDGRNKSPYAAQGVPRVAGARNDHSQFSAPPIGAPVEASRSSTPASHQTARPALVSNSFASQNSSPNLPTPSSAQAQIQQTVQEVVQNPAGNNGSLPGSEVGGNGNTVLNALNARAMSATQAAARNVNSAAGALQSGLRGTVQKTAIGMQQSARAAANISQQAIQDAARKVSDLLPSQQIDPTLVGVSNVPGVVPSVAGSASPIQSTVSPDSLNATTTRHQLVSAQVDANAPVPVEPVFFMDGYCCVTLLEDNKWVKGDKRWGVTHRGKTYLFQTTADQQKFLANPDGYSPVLAGYDPVVMRDTGQLVPGFRAHGVKYKDRIFLFSSEDSLNRFWQAPWQYADAAKQAMQGAVVRR